jgi:hypothetical protein
MDQYVHNGYNMDYQAMPPTDLSVLVAPDALVAALVAILGAHAAAPARLWFTSAASGSAAATSAAAASPTAPVAECRRIASRSPSLRASRCRHWPRIVRRTFGLPLGWPGEPCDFKHPRDYIGFDGGGGIGSGPGHGHRRGACATRIRTAALLRCWATAIT